jgi:hypothetical protein
MKSSINGIALQIGYVKNVFYSGRECTSLLPKIFCCGAFLPTRNVFKDAGFSIA